MFLQKLWSFAECDVPDSARFGDDGIAEGFLAECRAVLGIEHTAISLSVAADSGDCNKIVLVGTILTPKISLHLDIQGKSFKLRVFSDEEMTQDREERLLDAIGRVLD